MDILVEILELFLEIFFHAAGSNQSSRSKRLISYAIIFIFLCLFIYLSYVVREEVIMKWGFILLSVIMAFTLVKSIQEILRLIKNEEV